MNICAVELKSNQAILVVFDDSEFIDLKIKKILLEDDEKQTSIREFCNQFLLFLEQNEIKKVFIKKRAKKGNFAGGAVTFKMEGLIQLNPLCDVDLISSQTVAAFEKKNVIEFPEKLMKYQEQAFLTGFSQI